MAGVSRVLILSLGNPRPYLNTLHSAGHMALAALWQQLPEQPPFAAQAFGGMAAPASVGPRYILAQSPVLMNVSGPWAAKAWKNLVGARELAPQLGLVVLHDDMEEALGVVKVRRWKTSDRGHNGLKSIKKSLVLNDWPGAQWIKLSVGVGRPAERDAKTVSDYVLSNMDRGQKAILDGTGPSVLEALGQIEDYWAASADAVPADKTGRAEKHKTRKKAPKAQSQTTG